MGFFSNLFPAKNTTDFKELVKQGAVIIDVRTAAEYKSGHLAGSINIELEKVNKLLVDFKKKHKPVIAVCRSGNRSGVAVNILKAAGIEAYNGGAWNHLQRKLA
jgi:phage shock protein E